MSEIEWHAMRAAPDLGIDGFEVRAVRRFGHGYAGIGRWRITMAQLQNATVMKRITRSMLKGQRTLDAHVPPPKPDDCRCTECLHIKRVTQ